jgi:hypothetical protein
MAGDLTEQKHEHEHEHAANSCGETAFEFVYEFDAKGASKAYKRFLWTRVQRVILISSAISLACLVGIFTWEANVFLVLGSAYPAAYVILWLSQLGHIDETYEALAGRKIRLLIDQGGISTYFGNTFKRVQWLGVKQVVAHGDFYFIYFERDSVPTSGFPKSVISDGALDFLRERTRVLEEV